LHRSPGNRRLLVEDEEGLRHPAFHLLVLDSYEVAPECGAASSHDIPIMLSVPSPRKGMRRGPRGAIAM
jgi:hypothetical protein